MLKNDIIMVYLSRFTQIRDEFGGVVFNVSSDDLVILALLGLPKS